MEQQSTYPCQKEMVSFWLGRHSQNRAYSFYSLQAEQMFEESEDPVDHHAIWKDVDGKKPRMIVFDTEIPRLAKVRQTDHAKMINKIKDMEVHNMFPNVDTTAFNNYLHNSSFNKQPADQLQSAWPEFSNWTDNENNYCLVDTNFTEVNSGSQMADFQFHQQCYRINQEITENRIRRQLEQCDYLKIFTICSDERFHGFTLKLLEGLRDQCPKIEYMFTTINDCPLSKVSNFPIQSFSGIYDLVNFYLPMNCDLNFPWTSSGSISQQMAPLFNTLYTPFIIGNSNPYQYFHSVVPDSRHLFNAAHCLPIIDTDNQLNDLTDIFEYELAGKTNCELKSQTNTKQLNAKQQQSVKVVKSQLNFCNQTYLGLGEPGHFISESYILKGHFKSMEKKLKQRQQQSSLHLKYLSGIFSTPEYLQLNYTNKYKPYYGDHVENYPYHTCLFNHSSFGNGLRMQIKSLPKSKIFNEEMENWRQQVLEIADKYQEELRR